MLPPQFTGASRHPAHREPVILFCCNGQTRQPLLKKVRARLQEVFTFRPPRPSTSRALSLGFSGKLLFLIIAVCMEYSTAGAVCQLFFKAMGNYFVALSIYFAALEAATKFHFDGPKALPLESARTLAGPGPAVRRRPYHPFQRIRPAVEGRSSNVISRSAGFKPATPAPPAPPSAAGLVPGRACR